MGLGDVISNTLLRVKADTSQAKTEIRSLRGEERKAAQERLAELEKTNRGIEKQMAVWAKATLAIGASVAAFKLAQTAAKSYLEDVRLESAAAGANIERLTDATRGLIEEDQLLAFAGKAQAGVWKLNQAEMETVLRGATALRKTMGLDLQPTIEALTDSIAKGSTRALKEFGIEAKDKAGALRQLDAIYQGLRGNVAMTGDEFNKSGVAFKNAMDKMMGDLGRFVVSLTPVIAALAEVASILADIGDNLGDRLIDPSGAFTGTNLFSGKVFSQKEYRRRQQEAAQERAQVAASGNADFWAFMNGISPTAAPRKGGGGSQIQFLGNRMGMAGLDVNAIGQGIASGFMAGLGKLRTDKTFETINDNLNGGFTGQSINESLASGQDSISKLLADFAAFDAQKKQGQSVLTSIFGTPAEIEEMSAAIRVASSAFDGLANAAVAGFDAWITGQESVSKAFSKAIAEMLRALAGQMLVESLKHTAMGVGALAIPGLQINAGAHFKAAGLFAGVAAVAGVTAKSIGGATGQWSQGAGASAGGGTGAPARTVSDRQTATQAAPTIIYVGAEWAAMSAIDQSAAIVRAIDLGRRGSPHIRRH